MDIAVNKFIFVQLKNDFWISGVEICRKLGYKNPAIQAVKIWNKHKDRLEKYSVLSKLVSTDNKSYNTRCYNEIGARFFIAKCNMPIADDVTESMIQCFVKLKNKEIDQKIKQTQLEWQEARADGKVIRRNATDAIKRLVDSAKE